MELTKEQALAYQMEYNRHLVGRIFRNDTDKTYKVVVFVSIILFGYEESIESIQQFFGYTPTPDKIFAAYHKYDHDRYNLYVRCQLYNQNHEPLNPSAEYIALDKFIQ